MKRMAIAVSLAAALAAGWLWYGGINMAVFAGTEKPPDLTWHECVSTGGDSNFAGFQSAAAIYKCKEGVLRIEGKWGESIQDGWEYHTRFGELNGVGPEYVGDLPRSEQMPSFQKWCPSKYGFELCGWNEEEDARQQARRKEMSKKQPAFKK